MLVRAGWVKYDHSFGLWKPVAGGQVLFGDTLGGPHPGFTMFLLEVLSLSRTHHICQKLPPWLEFFLAHEAFKRQQCHESIFILFFFLKTTSPGPEACYLLAYY
jgi:hypothetical protein